MHCSTLEPVKTRHLAVENQCTGVITVLSQGNCAKDRSLISCGNPQKMISGQSFVHLSTLIRPTSLIFLRTSSGLWVLGTTKRSMSFLLHSISITPSTRTGVWLSLSLQIEENSRFSTGFFALVLGATLLTVDLR